MKRTEAEFSKYVYDTIKTFITPDFEVEECQNILSDLTCIFENGKFQMVHGFSETDIAIFKRVKFDLVSEKFFRFYGDKLIHKGEIAIPMVVLELKQGKVTTDAIRSRDFVAQRIRTIFPFSAFFFLAENTSKENKTLLRQGKNFTNYFIVNKEMSYNDIQGIYDDFILPHLSHFQESFEIN